MKKTITVFALLISVIGFLSAQEKFNHGNIKIGHDIYDVRVNVKSSIVGVSNLSKNVKEIPVLDREEARKTIPIEDHDIHVDTALTRSVIIETLKGRLNDLKENKDFFSVSYVFYPDGKVMNIDYILPSHTIITPKELATIDKRLRQEVKAVFTGEAYKAFPAIHYSRYKWINF